MQLTNPFPLGLHQAVFDEICSKIPEDEVKKNAAADLILGYQQYCEVISGEAFPPPVFFPLENQAAEMLMMSLRALTFEKVV